MNYIQAQQHDIASRQPDFDSVNVKAQHLELGESKMAAYTSQLLGRYTTLKNNAKVNEAKRHVKYLFRF